MHTWTSDEDLFTIIRQELFTAVVGDIMDKMGFQRQFLPPQVKPLHDDMFLVGRAMPVLEADAFGETNPGSANPLMAKPFGLMLEALDDLKRNEVYVCTGSSPTYALWGELMTCRAQILGAAGVVVNGYVRDKKGILEQQFPVFSYGSYAQDQGPRGKVLDFRTPIEMNGARIADGDILLGDLDGVCVVPREVEEEVFRRAIEKARGEKVVRKAIQEGLSAREAFEKFGIL